MGVKLMQRVTGRCGQLQQFGESRVEGRDARLSVLFVVYEQVRWFAGNMG